MVHCVECGPMPNVMAALPNIGGALCSTPQSLADVQEILLLNFFRLLIRALVAKI